LLEHVRGLVHVGDDEPHPVAVVLGDDEFLRPVLELFQSEVDFGVDEIDAFGEVEVVDDVREFALIGEPESVDVPPEFAFVRERPEFHPQRVE